MNATRHSVAEILPGGGSWPVLAISGFRWWGSPLGDRKKHREGREGEVRAVQLFECLLGANPARHFASVLQLSCLNTASGDFHFPALHVSVQVT